MDDYIYKYIHKYGNVYTMIDICEDFEMYDCNKVVEGLVKNNSELVHRYTGLYKTPSILSLACKRGFYMIVEFLLKNGASVNGYYKKDGDKTMIAPDSTPIGIAYSDIDYREDFYKETVEILIKYGADETKLPEYKDEYLSEEIPLLYGIVSGDLEKISKYLAKRSNVDSFRYAFNKTALMHACKNGNFEVAITLISAGADINAKDNNGKTVLNYAAKGGNVEIMKLLLAQGADNGVKK